jgi:hypothetical protein
LKTRNTKLAFIVDRYGLPATAVLLLAGHFAPWAAHKTAALTLSAHELAVFTHFTPGAGIFMNQWFYLPLWSSALLLALVASQPGWWVNRAISGAGCALIASLGLPGYPQIVTAFRSPDYQLQFFVSLAVMAAVVVIALWPLGRLALLRSAGRILLSLIAAVPLIGYLAVKPFIEQLYGDTVGLGAGWWLTLVAVLLGLTVVTSFRKLSTC